jgi:hypothetical protein
LNVIGGADMKMEKAMKEKKTGPYKGPDLSDKPKTFTHALKPLIAKMGTMTYDDLKKEFIDLLNSGDVSVSKEKKQFYFNNLAKQKTLKQLMFFIADIEMAGSGLGVIK